MPRPPQRRHSGSRRPRADEERRHNCYSAREAYTHKVRSYNLSAAIDSMDDRHILVLGPFRGMIGEIDQFLYLDPQLQIPEST